MKISYSIQQVCALTGIGQTKVYEAIKNGLLNAKKYGRRTIILKDDLDEFLESLPDLNQKHNPP